ncbi:MAG: hypothetical protein JWO20_1387 [Candidatus Angelobacter sp.]|nr:hypothetical protein [Candidatus Angelobacter sp.]
MKEAHISGAIDLSLPPPLTLVSNWTAELKKQ